MLSDNGVAMAREMLGDHRYTIAEIAERLGVSLKHALQKRPHAPQTWSAASLASATRNIKQKIRGSSLGAPFALPSADTAPLGDRGWLNGKKLNGGTFVGRTIPSSSRTANALHPHTV